MARYADYLARARIEQIIDEHELPDLGPEGDGVLLNYAPADILVNAAVSTTFLPRRRQIQITFDLPTDDDTDDDDGDPDGD